MRVNIAYLFHSDMQGLLCSLTELYQLSLYCPWRFLIFLSFTYIEEKVDCLILKDQEWKTFLNCYQCQMKVGNATPSVV